MDPSLRNGSVKGLSKVGCQFLSHHFDWIIQVWQEGRAGNEQDRHDGIEHSKISKSR